MFVPKHLHAKKRPTGAPSKPSASNPTATPASTKIAYIIQCADLETYGPRLQCDSGDLIPVRLQKYQFSPQKYQFLPVFPSALEFQLSVTRLFDRADANRDLPYQLDGIATNIGKLSDLQQKDPIIIAIQQQLRLTFRYDPYGGHGCLVHLGIDLDPVDDTMATLLWRSAINHDFNQS